MITATEIESKLRKLEKEESKVLSDILSTEDPTGPNPYWQHGRVSGIRAALIMVMDDITVQYGE